MEWIVQLPVLFFSVIAHEFAHGFTAYKRGDDTAYLSGRLTLNPLPHIDLIGTVVLPLISIFNKLPVIGWAKPVPVNPYRLYNSRKDMALVALSGPASNFLLALVSAVFYKIFLSFGFLGYDLTSTLLMAFGFGVIINLALGIFNLMPVFPLDGSQILMGILPDKWLAVYEKHIPYGMFIILFMVITGVIKYIIFPVVIFALWLLAQIGIVITAG
ncbi:MAG: site-2 protease family protein [Elusimicrobia bacterium]|nr:site-2 protease family protein [Elusimicrobiota bacterium]